MKKKLLISLLGTTAAAAAYLKLIRPQLIYWGATEDEIYSSLPGDDLVTDPTYVTTRAITIGNGPEEVWPWIVQMGENRGGFYGYDFLERLLGMKIHSAHRILPRYQEVEKGQALDRGGNIVVRHVDPGRVLVLGKGDGGFDIDFAWTLALFPIGERQTRLVSRVRAWFDLSSPRALAMLALLEPGQFIMERKFLREIKIHAEGLAEKWPPETPVTLH